MLFWLVLNLNEADNKSKIVKRILFSASRPQEESFKQKKFVISYNFIGNVVVVVLN